MRVLMLGGSGFIGRHLAAALRARGDDVVTASLRNPENAAEIARSCDAIVNLAGESVAQRWTPEVKRRIEESRVVLPRRFLDALSRDGTTARAYVSASAVGYYGIAPAGEVDEDEAPGDDFLARVCVAWEREASRARDLGMRVAYVRTGIALSPDGGALAKLLPIFRIGLGGRVGDGRQWMPWIHIADLVAVYLEAIDRAEGPLNAVAPHPVTNADFTRILARTIRRPAIVPVPAFVLRLMLGEGAVVLLGGQHAVPSRLLRAGFTFAFPELAPALADLLCWR
jgi:uncharacterized protein (TIGR01777 family)